VGFLSYWRRALYGGLQASALATAGWVVVLILQAVLANPRRMLLSLMAGPLLHLCWDHGRSWLLGASAEHEGSGWKRLALWTLGVAAVLAVIERANEYLDVFLASVLMIFPAGVILTLAVLLFGRVWPRLRDSPDPLSEVFFRVIVAVPLSVLVAGAVAGVSLALGRILAPSEGGRFVSLLWWWTPAAFGFLLAARRPNLAPFLSVLLLIGSGIFNTYQFKSEGRAATHQFQFGRDASSRIPALPMLPARGWNRGIADRAIDWVWREFDPKNFLSAVSEPFVPASFSFRAEEEQGLESTQLSGSGERRFQRIQQFIRMAGRVCGCPPDLSPAEKDEALEASETLSYWRNLEGAELAVFEAHHGSFCAQLRMGLRSGMIRSWVILLFLGWGIARAVRAPAPARPERGGLRAVGVATLGALVVLLGAAYTMRAPSRPVVRLSPSWLPAAGGEMNVSWSASPADHYAVRSAPDVDGIPEGATTATQAHLKVRANPGEEPVWYKITVDAKGFFDVPSTRTEVSFPVAPGQTLPARLQTLDGLDQYSVSAMAVDESGAFYVALAPMPASMAEQILRSAHTPGSLIAKYDARGVKVWKKELVAPSGVELGEPCCIKVDRAHNIYLGSTSRHTVDTGAPGGPEERSVAHLTQFDSLGGFGWTREIKAGQSDILTSLAVDDGSNIYAAGTTGPAEINYADSEFLLRDTDGFLARFDAHGTPGWPAPLRFGTDGEDGATGVAVDEDGLVYVTGFTEAAGYFKRLGGVNEYQAFLAKFDREGRARWVRRLGWLGASKAARIAISPGGVGNVYVLGGENDPAFLGAYTNEGVEPWLYAPEFSRPVDLAARAGAVYQVSGDLVAKRDRRGGPDWARQFGGGPYETRVLVAGPLGLYVSGKAGGHVFVGSLMDP
jgi:hypothetical protein